MRATSNLKLIPLSSEIIPFGIHHLKKGINRYEANIARIFAQEY